MYVLSNKLKNYGAACIAYPYILDMLAGVLKENFYVLPSSVHEVIIVPESSQIRQSELERMVREINETQVPEEEILSNHAYFYYAQEGNFSWGKRCVSTGRKMNERTRRDYSNPLHVSLFDLYSLCNDIRRHCQGRRT